MKTHLCYIFIACLIAVSCKKNEPEFVSPVVNADTIKTDIEKPSPNTAVVSGNSIGNIALDMDAERLEPILGKPDLSDSAMGKSWMTWYSDNSKAVSGKFELNVYTAYKDSDMKQKVVRLVRATSPEFAVETIGPGENLEHATAKFAQLKNVGDYAFGTTKDFVSIYDDKPNGVAFEFLGDSCISIIVHPKGKDVTLDYRMFRPDMTIR